MNKQNRRQQIKGRHVRLHNEIISSQLFATAAIIISHHQLF